MAEEGAKKESFKAQGFTLARMLKIQAFILDTKKWALVGILELN